jgi:hypothetical protein
MREPFMRELRAEIDIAASATKVWSILTNFNSRKEWNPIVNQASGVASSGSTLTITMRGSDGKDGPKYMPNITKIEEPKFFRWRVKMAGSIFTSDKVFELKETSLGARLVHKELYSGIMARIYWKKLDSAVPSMLNSTNDALKKLAEKGSN